MKKIISLVLVAILLLSLLPMAVFAEGNTGEIVLPPDCFHKFSYTDNEDGETHTVTCQYCGGSYSEAHAFVNGVCVCGAEEPVEDPYYDGNLVFFQKALNLESTISTQFLVNANAAGLKGVYTQYKIHYEHIFADGRPNDSQDVDMTVFATRYRYAEMPTRSTDMSDTFVVTLYGLKDGEWYHGESVNWSVRDGALAMIRNSGTAATQKTLLASMLNYGAAAQLQMNYNTGDLANATMTPEEAALALTTPAAPLTNDLAVVGSGDLAAYQQALLLDSAIETQFIFQGPKGATPDGSTMEAHMTYVKSNGTEVSVVVDVNNLNARLKYVSFSAQAAKDMRGTVTCQLFDKATQQAVSPAVTYSGVTYAYQKANDSSASATTKNLANALICYVDAAIAHFG